MSMQSIMARIAGRGPAGGSRPRRSNRPRGEGIGFVDSIKRLFSRR